MTTLGPGAAAPDFTLDGLDHLGYRLGELTQRGPVILAFGKADCNTCWLAFPYLERLYEAYPREGWTLLGLLQDSPSQARRFARKHGLTFPMVVEPAPYAVSREYDPEATPTIFLIDGEGAIVQVAVAFSKNALNALAAELARLIDRPAAIIAPANDGKPAFRPG